MTYIPDCRTDEYYNERYLNEQDKEFIRGYDWAVEQIANLFNNLEVFPDAEELLADNKAVIKENKAEVMMNAIENWAEMSRDELITSMIDCMSDEEYNKMKEEADKE